MPKFKFFNDTGGVVYVHPATEIHGTVSEMTPIQPLEERIFEVPNGTYPWVKMWDYGELGLSILVSPEVDEEAKE